MHAGFPDYPEDKENFILNFLLQNNYRGITKTGKQFLHLANAGERRYQQQDSPLSRKYIPDTPGKSFYHSTPVLPAIKGILEPVIDPLCRLRREVGGIEKNQVKRNPKSRDEIGPYCLNTSLAGTENCVRIDIGCNNHRYLRKLVRDEAGSDPDLQYTVTRFHLLPGCFEQEIRISVGLVYLGLIEGHCMKNAPSWAKRDCLAVIP